MKQGHVQLLSILAGLAVVALFPLPFYIGLGVLRWKDGWQVALLASIGLGIALLAVFVTMRVQRALTPEVRHAGEKTQAEWAEEKRRALALLAAEPALERWRHLVEQWGQFTVETVRRYEARYQELLRRPHGAPYAEMLLKGDWRGDEEIDYQADPERVATCAHLAPIERDLRRYGIRSGPAPLPHAPRRLWTEAYLDLKQLAPHYDVSPLSEETYYDHPRDPGFTLISCKACDAHIDSRGGMRFPPVGQASRPE